MDLSEIRRHYISEGYSTLNASAKTCQDVVLAKIAASPLKENVTVKGRMSERFSPNTSATR